MKSNALTMIAVLALLSLLAEVAGAHGGIYTGPIGGGTPTYGGPHGAGTPGTGGTTGGGTPGGGTTGGGTPGGQTGGGGGAGAPARPGGTGTPGGRGPGAATPGGKKSAEPSDTIWNYWWELNDDRFLRLKSVVRTTQDATSNVDAMLGLADGGAVARVTTLQIRNAVAPALKLGLQDQYFDARAGAAIALGKVADETVPDAVPLLTGMLHDADLSVREAACLALGMAGGRDAVATLMQVMKGEAQLGPVGAGTHATRYEGAFAAVGIGMAGQRGGVDAAVVRELVHLLVTPAPRVDTQIAPALALGLLKAHDAAPDLIKFAMDQEAPELVRAHVITALAKMGEATIVPWLVTDGLDNKYLHVARSAAIALGQLTNVDDAATVDAIIRHARAGKERAVRNFCLIALGEIGGTKARDNLVDAVRRGNSLDRTFGALGLGIYGTKNHADRAEAGGFVLEAWNGSKNDAEKGAFAIALGMLEHQAAAPVLSEELRAGGSPELKGYVCLALGMIGDRSQLAAIRERARSSSDLDAQRRAATALGLLRDPAAVPMLLKVLDGAGGNLSSLGAVATALGHIGDRSAVAPLAKLLENAGHDVRDNARTFAAVALGLLGDKDEFSLIAQVQENCNYLAATPALQELLTIL